MLKISDYEFLCVLHSCMNITQAARKLFISQPALTKRLKQIEQELNTVLVYRNIKGVCFTPEGEYVVAYAKKCMDDYKEVRRVLQGFQSDAQTIVSIVASNTMCLYVLPQLLSAFKQENPDISCNLENAVSSESGQMVYNEQADVGFVCGKQPWSFRHDFICQEYMTLISKKMPDLEKLPYLPRIDPRMTPGSRTAVNNWWQQNFDVPPYIGMNVLTMENCIEMIKHGLGYSILFHSCFLREGDGLCQQFLCDNSGKFLQRSNYIVYRDDTTMKDSTKKFVEFCHDYFMDKYHSLHP